jgi:uncharacterized protein YggE
MLMTRRDPLGPPLTLVLALALAPAVLVAAARADDSPRGTLPGVASPPLLSAQGPAARPAAGADDEDDDDDDEDDAMDVNKLPSLSVSGEGKVSAAPDTADVNVGVVTQAPTAKEALAANTEAMTKLIATLKEQGIAEKDVQTQNLSIQPQYTQPPRNRENQEFVPKIAAYQVTNTVQVTSRKIDALGGILDALVQSGANQMYGISFRVDKPEALLDEARVAAVSDAKRKAELIAKAAGVKLGPPIQISESGTMPMPRPLMMRGMAAAPMMAASAPVPVAGGEQDFSVSVSVTYQIVTKGQVDD